MEKRRLGRTDLDLPALCLGAMMFGDQISEKDAVEQMDACVARGINFFDTAELYTIPPKPETQGESERIVGRWLAARKNRSEMIIATKVTGRSSMPWIRDGSECRLTRDQILAAVEGSLRNLQTDYIDLYQLHWPDRKIQLFGADRSGFRHHNDDAVPFEETLAALDDLARAGKIRHIGVSNETPYGVMRFLAEAEKRSLPRIVSVQNAYSLVNRMFENGLAEIAMEEQVGLLAYSPIAQGALTGKYLGGVKPEGSRGAMFGRLGRYETTNAEAAISGYVNIAKDFGVHPAALAMQFVTTRPFVTSNIFGANGMDQLQIIFDSLDLRWTDDMEEAVRALHEAAPNPCP